MNARSKRYHVIRTSNRTGYSETAWVPQRKEALRLARAYTAQAGDETIVVHDTWRRWNGDHELFNSADQGSAA